MKSSYWLRTGRLGLLAWLNGAPSGKQTAGIMARLC